MSRLNTLSALLASVGALTLGGPAAAQQASTDAPQAKSSEIQEVVVTAQKKLQASSKVSLSLSVISDEDLKGKGISTAANLTEQVPNIQIGMGNAGGMEITIRGIGNADNTERGDPQAAFHVDGIYVGRPQGAGATFFDLERVEVLRGPQGTLYGRNANAGAVNLISRKPSGKLQGQVDVEVGDYNAQKIDAMLNVPVTEAFGLRAVISSQKHDGYSNTANATNGFSRNRDDQEALSGRLLGLFKFSPSTSLLVGVDSSKIKGAGQAAFDITSGTLPTNRTLDPQVEGKVDNTSDGLMGEFKTTLGFADFVYLYGHRSAKRNEISSLGAAPGIYQVYSDSFKQDSHELRLASNGSGPLQWVAGLYAFKEEGRNIDLDVLLPPQFGGGRAVHFVQNPAISESKAVFGQMTYDLAADWRVTGGLRQTQDDKSREGQTRVGPADTPIGVVGNRAKGSWSQLTYRLGLEHDISKTQMAYVNLATGYKAGGFNDGNAVAGDPNFNPNLYYNPEKITSLEAGIKGRYLDNKLQLGASAFYYDYADLQKSAVVNNQLNTLNAAKAEVTGLEFEGKAAVTDNGRLNFALGLLSAKYKKYTTPNGQDFAGQTMDRAPKATLTLGYTHNWDLDSGARISAYLGSRLTTSYVLSDTGTATQAPRLFTQASTTKSDFTLTYSGADDKWSLQAFAKNLEDKSSAAGLFTLNGSNYAYLAEPRTLGVRGSVKF